MNGRKAAKRGQIKLAWQLVCVSCFVAFFLYSLCKRTSGEKGWRSIESTTEAFTALTRQLLGLKRGALSPVLYKEVLSLVPRAEDAATCCGVVVLSKHWEHGSSAPCRARRPKEPLFIRQTVGSSCGSISALHVLAAAEAQWKAAHSGSALCATLGALNAAPTATDAGALFASDERIAAAHAAVAGIPSSSKARSAAVRQQHGASYHYVTFVCAEGTLWELDSLAPVPIDRGACAPNELLGQVLQVAKAKHATKATGGSRLVLLSAHTRY